MVEGPGDRPAVRSDSGQCPSGRGFKELSRATRARVRGPANRATVSRDSGPGPSACRVDHPSRATWAGSKGPWGRAAVLGVSGQFLRARNVEQLSRALALGSEGPQGLPAVPGNSGPGPRARMVDQLSRATRNSARRPEASINSSGRLLFLSEGPWSTSFPGRLGPGSEATKGRPAVPGDSGPCPRGHGFEELSRVTGPCPRAHGVERLSQGIQARARGTTVSTRRPGRHGPRYKCPRVRPAVPGDSGPCP